MANLVRVKEKFQLTIPLALRRQFALSEGDYLEATVLDNSIVLRPTKRMEAMPKAQTLVDFLREPRDRQRSRAEIDASLAADRDAWPR